MWKIVKQSNFALFSCCFLQKTIQKPTSHQKRSRPTITRKDKLWGTLTAKLFRELWGTLTAKLFRENRIKNDSEAERGSHEEKQRIENAPPTTNKKNVDR